MKQNLLLIAHHFLPYTPSFGMTARCYFMAEHFAKHYHIYILSAKGKENYGYFGKSINKDTKITYVFDKHHKSSESIAIPGKSKIQKIVFLLKEYGFRKLIKVLYLRESGKIKLDKFEFSVYKFYKAAKTIIGKNDITTIIISVPPVSVMKICIKLKKRFPNTKIILDYRDSWVIPALLNNMTIKGKRSRCIEKKSITLADGVVFISPSMKKEYDNYYNISNKSILLTNGFNSSPNIIPKAKLKRETDKVVKIGYFGKMHIGNKDYFRDIRKFFDFLKKSNEAFKSQFLLHSFGYISGEYEKWEKEIPFKYCGVVKSDMVQTLMSDYDFLLLYHSESVRAEEVLTSKVFEYILSKKPIIVLGPKNMVDARNLIENNNLGIFINIEDESDIKYKLNYLYELKINNEIENKYNSNFDVTQFDREIINGKYVKYIEQI